MRDSLKQECREESLRIVVQCMELNNFIKSDEFRALSELKQSLLRAKERQLLALGEINALLGGVFERTLFHRAAPTHGPDAQPAQDEHVSLSDLFANCSAPSGGAPN